MTGLLISCVACMIVLPVLSSVDMSVVAALSFIFGVSILCSVVGMLVDNWISDLKARNE